MSVMASQANRYIGVAVSLMYTMDIDGICARRSPRNSYQLLYCHLCRRNVSQIRCSILWSPPRGASPPVQRHLEQSCTTIHRLNATGLLSSPLPHSKILLQFVLNREYAGSNVSITRVGALHPNSEYCFALEIEIWGNLFKSCIACFNNLFLRFDTWELFSRLN